MQRQTPKEITKCDPCGKTLFLTRKAAEKGARRFKLRFYECPVGPGFHLGHKPQTAEYHARREAAADQSSPNRASLTVQEMEEWARRARFPETTD